MAFPKFASVVEIGHTTEGRPIKAVKLHQEGGRIDKKAIFLDAGMVSTFLSFSHTQELINSLSNKVYMQENGLPQQLSCT